MSTYSSFREGASAGRTWARVAGGRCRCSRECVCAAGTPCRCRSRCTCDSMPSLRADAWSATGELEEIGRARFARPGRTAGFRPARLHPRAQAFVARQSFARRVQERQRWNRYFARRLGWSRHVAPIARLLGCPQCAPGSRTFAAALARWQRGRGLRATGVLTPGLWRWMRGYLARAPLVSGPAWALPPEPAAVPDDAPVDARLDGEPGEPSHGAPAVDAGATDPSDRGAPGSEDSVDTGEVPFGFRARKRAMYRAPGAGPRFV